MFSNRVSIGQKIQSLKETLNKLEGSANFEKSAATPYSPKRSPLKRHKYNHSVDSKHQQLSSSPLKPRVFNQSFDSSHDRSMTQSVKPRNLNSFFDNEQGLSYPVKSQNMNQTFDSSIDQRLEQKDVLIRDMTLLQNDLYSNLENYQRKIDELVAKNKVEKENNAQKLFVKQQKIDRLKAKIRDLNVLTKSERNINLTTTKSELGRLNTENDRLKTKLQNCKAWEKRTLLLEETVKRYQTKIEKLKGRKINSVYLSSSYSRDLMKTDKDKFYTIRQKQLLSEKSDLEIIKSMLSAISTQEATKKIKHLLKTQDNHENAKKFINRIQNLIGAYSHESMKTLNLSSLFKQVQRIFTEWTVMQNAEYKEIVSYVTTILRLQFPEDVPKVMGKIYKLKVM